MREGLDGIVSMVQSMVDLIDHERCWKYSLVKRFYHPLVAYQILRFSLPKENFNDKVVQTQSQAGVYTVKKGYYLAKASSVEDCAESASSTDLKLFWSRFCELGFLLSVQGSCGNWYKMLYLLKLNCIKENFYLQLLCVLWRESRNRESFLFLFFSCSIARAMWFAYACCIKGDLLQNLTFWIQWIGSGCGLLQQWDVLASVLNCIGDHVLMGSLCSWL